MNPNKKRLRRTMMFLNAQKPGLIKDPHIYKPDSIMLDLEDAVAENQKDAARFSLYHALQEIDYRGCERVVRINGLDTPYWKEDIRCAVAGGCDAIRIPKTERPEDVKAVEAEIRTAEEDFGIPEGRTLIMAAIESARGVVKALDVCEASERLFGIALSGGDYTKDLQTYITGTGIDGKSILNPRQIPVVHEIFTPAQKNIIFAAKVVMEIEDKRGKGIGVFIVDGKMIDIAFYDGAKRTIELAKASGVYKGGL